MHFSLFASLYTALSLRGWAARVFAGSLLKSDSELGCQTLKTRPALQGTVLAEKSSDWVAMAFNPHGVYGVAADGSTAKINAENWIRTRVALQSRPGEVLSFHDSGVFRMRVADEDCARLEAPFQSTAKINAENWIR